MNQLLFPRSRNSGCHMYAPSIEQVLEMWDMSQLRLPPYRFKHNERHHPYVRYVDPVEREVVLDILEQRAALRQGLVVPPPPPPIYQDLEAGDPAVDTEQPFKLAEEEERKRFIQVTRNLSAAADRLSRVTRT